MAETQTNLRQAEATVEVEGILSEKKLEIIEEDGMKKIKGSLVIQTSDVNFVTFNVNVGQMTKAGKPNSIYEGIFTVMNEYKSVAEVGKDDATRVRVTKGDINPYTYYNERGKHDVVGFKSNFFNRVNPVEMEQKSIFDVELYISSISREIVASGEEAGTETGRVKVNGWMPTYNGIEPLTLIATAEDGIADAIESEYEPGQTVLFSGDLVNNRVVKTETIPMKIGKPKIKTTTTYTNEFIITGASEAYEEGITSKAPYEPEVIQKAIAEREIKLAEMKDKADKKGNNPQSSGAFNKAKPSSGRTLPTF